MAIKMKALRAVYIQAHRKEYKAGQEFSVLSDDEADRLARRNKAERVGAAKNPTDLPESPAASAAPDLAAARREYEETVGRRPYHGWDVAELRSRANNYRTTNMGDSTLTTDLTARE